MDMLARREHSYYELEQKLGAMLSESARSSLQPVLEQLCEENLVSDERFCEAFVRSRRNKAYGAMRIAAELNARGVADTLVKAYLEDTEESWLEQLIALIKKKYGTHYGADAATRAKQQRFLAQRGYSFEQIRSAFAQIEQRYSR